MIVDRQKGEISEIPFHELRDFLGPGDRLIFNDTKVIPARLVGRRPSGGRAEIFLTTPEGDGTWCAFVKPGKKLPIGAEVHFDETFHCKIVEVSTFGGYDLIREAYAKAIADRFRFYSYGDAMLIL